jgi:hypothetical protein
VIERENHRDCTCAIGKPTRNGDNRNTMYIQENQNTAAEYNTRKETQRKNKQHAGMAF